MVLANFLVLTICFALYK